NIRDERNHHPQPILPQDLLPWTLVESVLHADVEEPVVSAQQRLTSAPYAPVDADRPEHRVEDDDEPVLRGQDHLLSFARFNSRITRRAIVSVDSPARIKSVSAARNRRTTSSSLRSPHVCHPPV